MADGELVEIDLDVIKQFEKESWVKNLKMAGMDETMSVQDAVRAALFGSGVPNLSPDEAAVRENLIDEGIDTFEIDLENLPDAMFISEGEEDEDKEDPYIAYYQMQLLDTIRPEAKTPEERSENEKVMVKLLFHGLTDLCKAAKLQARGYDKIKLVLERQPELRNLVTLLRPLDKLAIGNDTTTESSNSGAIKTTLGNTGTGARGGSGYKPKRILVHGKSRFICPFQDCEVVKHSWCACDAHIGKEHTGWRYGPCKKCKTFLSFNRDAFKNHQKNCKNTMNE